MDTVEDFDADDHSKTVEIDGLKCNTKGDAGMDTLKDDVGAARVERTRKSEQRVKCEALCVCPLRVFMIFIKPSRDFL